jgi:hypothetical protein
VGADMKGTSEDSPLCAHFGRSGAAGHFSKADINISCPYRR